MHEFTLHEQSHANMCTRFLMAVWSLCTPVNNGDYLVSLVIV